MFFGRLLVVLVIISVLIVVNTFLGDRGGPSPEKDEPAPILGIDRIAFVDHDNKIVTVDPDGANEIVVSPEDGRFTWPTWSPDGRQIAFSAVVGRGNDARQVLFAHDLATGESRELHTTRPGFRRLVAAAAPHYAMWSPDSTHLTFVGATDVGLMLYVDDLRDNAGPRSAIDKFPLYLDWSPDSSQLLVHRGAGHFLINADGGARQDLDVPEDEIGYRAPGWKPSGDAITFVSSDGVGGYALYNSSIDTVDKTLVDSVPLSTSFLWSPNAEYLAVTRPEVVLPLSDLGLFVYQRIGFYGGDGLWHTAEIEENVVSFFWSPSGERLAYVTLTDSPGVLRWRVFDVDSGESWSLMDFRPSSDQLTILQFFDQFARSHSLWSPDSRSLVFAGRLADNAALASAGGQENDRIIVVGADRAPTLTVIGEGTLALWSWR